jgi:hypothetical protein
VRLRSLSVAALSRFAVTPNYHTGGCPKIRLTKPLARMRGARESYSDVILRMASRDTARLCRAEPANRKSGTRKSNR